jgi:hypothetical protein
MTSTFFQSGNDGKRDTLIVTHPPHFPTMHTRETVTHLVAFGLDENQIAAVMKCTPDDVRRHYADELEHGLARVNSRVMSAVLHAALYEDSAADRKLWLMNRAGWKGGDGNRTNILNAPGVGEDGETLTVVQRREVITKLLVKATQHKRLQERVIDAEAVPVAKSTNGTNGNGTNGANGHGGGNGAKHR